MHEGVVKKKGVVKREKGVIKIEKGVIKREKGVIKIEKGVIKREKIKAVIWYLNKYVVKDIKKRLDLISMNSKDENE